MSQNLDLGHSFNFHVIVLNKDITRKVSDITLKYFMTMFHICLEGPMSQVVK